MTEEGAINYLRATSDQAHRFWGYYQAVTFAVIGFGWSNSMRSSATIFAVVFAYTIFVTLNFRLVIASQKCAIETWNVIQQYIESKGDFRNEVLDRITGFNKPDSPFIVGTLHVLLSFLSVLAIYAGSRLG